MNIIRASLVLGALLLSTAAQSQILKNDPGEGNLATGKKVLVNDGTCPSGQIKEVTGGSKTGHVARSSRCIPYRGKK
jgi:hypothetical protein